MIPLNERKEVLKITADETKGRIPVIALVGECETKAKLKNIDYAQNSAADAIMSTPPYYYLLDQKSILPFY
jgi:4-hydroxy-tetrahydrodipicolinate synthase